MATAVEKALTSVGVSPVAANENVSLRGEGGKEEPESAAKDQNLFTSEVMGLTVAVLMPL